MDRKSIKLIKLLQILSKRNRRCPEIKGLKLIIFGYKENSQFIENNRIRNVRIILQTSRRNLRYNKLLQTLRWRRLDSILQFHKRSIENNNVIHSPWYYR